MIWCRWHTVVDVFLMRLIIQMVVLSVIGDLDVYADVDSGGGVDIWLLL